MKPLLGVALFVAAWALVATRWPPHVLPGPLLVGKTLLEMSPIFAEDLLRSLSRVVSGYGAAVLAGLAVGAAMELSGTVDRQVSAAFSLLRPIPPFAWAPLLLLWVGVGDPSAILVVFAAAFFPVAAGLRAGLHGVPAPLREAARNLGASRLRVFLRVLLPGALPATTTGLRLGWNLAWMSVVAAEMLGADGGLGQRILDARNLARPDVALGGMLVIGVVAAFSEMLFGVVERRQLRWRP